MTNETNNKLLIEDLKNKLKQEESSLADIKSNWKKIDNDRMEEMSTFLKDTFSDFLNSDPSVYIKLTPYNHLVFGYKDPEGIQTESFTKYLTVDFLENYSYWSALTEDTGEGRPFFRALEVNRWETFDRVKVFASKAHGTTNKDQLTQYPLHLDRINKVVQTLFEYTPDRLLSEVNNICNKYSLNLDKISDESSTTTRKINALKEQIRLNETEMMLSLALSDSGIEVTNKKANKFNYREEYSRWDDFTIRNINNFKINRLTPSGKNASVEVVYEYFSPTREKRLETIELPRVQIGRVNNFLRLLLD